MGKKIPRDNGKRTKKQEHRVARATRRGVVAAPRAMPLHFPEQAQHLVCELLCDLRLAELEQACARREHPGTQQIILS